MSPTTSAPQFESIIHRNRAAGSGSWAQRYLLQQTLATLTIFAPGGDIRKWRPGQQGGDGCTYWLKPDLCEIEEAWSYNRTPRLRRGVRKIIFDHSDLIVGERERSFGGKDNAGD